MDIVKAVRIAETLPGNADVQEALQAHMEALSLAYFAVALFKESVMSYIDTTDRPMVRTAWNDYTDSLHRDGLITDRQVQTWDQPAFVKKG